MANQRRRSHLAGRGGRGRGWVLFPNALSLAFVNRTDGWLSVPGSQFRTRDGGARWTSGSQLDGLFQPSFASPTVGYGYGIVNEAQSLPYACCGASDFSLFPEVTVNGGATFRLARVPVPPGFRSALIQIGSAGDPDTAAFTGSQFAAIPVELIRPSDGARLCTTYHTDNGGGNWWYTAHNTTVCPQSYFNAQDGWGFTCIPADCAQSDTGAPAKVRSYHTTDGGEHWTYLGPKGNWDYQYVTPRIGFSSQLWYGGAIQRTTDAGRTFRLIWPRLVKG